MRQLEEYLGDRLQDDQGLARHLGRAVDVADLAGCRPNGGAPGQAGQHLVDLVEDRPSSESSRRAIAARGAIAVQAASRRRSTRAKPASSWNFSRSDEARSTA